MSPRSIQVGTSVQMLTLLRLRLPRSAPTYPLVGRLTAVSDAAVNVSMQIPAQLPVSSPSGQIPSSGAAGPHGSSNSHVIFRGVEGFSFNTSQITSLFSEPLCAPAAPRLLPPALQTLKLLLWPSPHNSPGTQLLVVLPHSCSLPASGPLHFSLPGVLSCLPPTSTASSDLRDHPAAPELTAYFISFIALFTPRPQITVIFAVHGLFEAPWPRPCPAGSHPVGLG